MPAAHGVGADAPSPHHECSVHAMQPVAPLAFWYVPAAHRSHAPLPEMGANEPGAHHPGSAEPVAHAAPAGHSTQSSCDVIEMISRASVTFWWRPDGQGNGEAAPTAQ